MSFINTSWNTGKQTQPSIRSLRTRLTLEIHVKKAYNQHICLCVPAPTYMVLMIIVPPRHPRPIPRIISESRHFLRALLPPQSGRP